MIQKEKIPYQHNNITFEGYAAYEDSGPAKKPVILIAHAWRGQTDFEREKAEKLAEKGYLAFAMDVFGKEIEAKNDDEAQKLMIPLFIDRSELRKRVFAAIEAIKKHPKADIKKIGAIGFCFGGLTVIELAKSGADVKGIVSIHGVIATNLWGNQAKLAPTSDNIISKILILQGHDDPMVNEEQISAFEKDLTDRKVDWQWHAYGNAMHSFTNPKADRPKDGMQYNPVAARRAWASLNAFFEEIFASEGRGV